MIKVGFIGCGKITDHHIKCLKKVSGIEPTAVCDLNFEKSKQYGKKYNLKYFENYDQMLIKENKINLVSIMTPSGMHYENAKDIIVKYKKNLIVEKPTFLKASHVKSIYKLAKKYKCKIFPVFQHRYNKSILRLKKAIQKDEIGKIRVANIRVRWCRPDRYYKLAKWRGTFSHDGGALSNQGIHHIDLLRFLCGEVTKVFSLMKTLGANIEVEDTAVGTFEFAKGGVGTIEVTTAARPDDFEASLSIVGSKGLAQIGGKAVNELQIFSPNQKICKRFSEKFKNGYGYGHIKFYKDIKSTLKSKNLIKFPISEKEVYNSTKLLNSLYKSDELKKFINVFSAQESKRLGRSNEKISNLYRSK
tara:strand:+ start:602 stop:1681 length:1080 start_codon:yes stop_codon:yes gene_type:complete